MLFLCCAVFLHKLYSLFPARHFHSTFFSFPVLAWRVGFKQFMTCCYVHSAAHVSRLKGILFFVFSLA